MRRNRARRRLRALARTELAKRARRGIDYVMIARNGTAERSWDDLVADLHKSLGYLHRSIERAGDGAGDQGSGGKNA